MDAAIFDAILSDIATHGNVRRAVRDSGFDIKQFYRETARDDATRQRYARAKQDGLDSLADEIIELADLSRKGTKMRETKDGPMIETGDMVERSRLQIESRKWLLAKLAPKKYGEKLELDARVSVGDAIVNRLMRVRVRGESEGE